jgi:hypothetical protein
MILVNGLIGMRNSPLLIDISKGGNQALAGIDGPAVALSATLAIVSDESF